MFRFNFERKILFKVVKNKQTHLEYWFLSIYFQARLLLGMFLYHFLRWSFYKT